MLSVWVQHVMGRKTSSYIIRVAFVGLAAIWMWVTEKRATCQISQDRESKEHSGKYMAREKKKTFSRQKCGAKPCQKPTLEEMFNKHLKLNSIHALYLKT